MITFLFGISMGEIIVVFLVVLLLFGADKIPEFARMLGKGMNEFRKAADDIKREFNENTSDLKDDLEDARRYINEQGRDIKEDIKRAGEEVKETLEERKEDAGKSVKEGTETARETLDETARDIYGINGDGRRNEAGKQMNASDDIPKENKEEGNDKRKD